MKISGERIRQAREIRGITRKQFAIMTHCTVDALNRYEADLEEPPQNVMDSIAVVTGFSPKFFRQPPPPNFGEGSLAFHFKCDGEEKKRRGGSYPAPPYSAERG